MPQTTTHPAGQSTQHKEPEMTKNSPLHILLLQLLPILIWDGLVVYFLKTIEVVGTPSAAAAVNFFTILSNLIFFYLVYWFSRQRWPYLLTLALLIGITEQILIRLVMPWTQIFHMVEYGFIHALGLFLLMLIVDWVLVGRRRPVWVGIVFTILLELSLYFLTPLLSRIGLQGVLYPLGTLVLTLALGYAVSWLVEVVAGKKAFKMSDKEFAPGPKKQKVEKVETASPAVEEQETAGEADPAPEGE